MWSVYIIVSDTWHIINELTIALLTLDFRASLGKVRLVKRLAQNLIRP